MQFMAKKTDKAKSSTRQGRNLNVYIKDAALESAFNDYLEKARPTPSVQSIVIAALEEYLAKRGFFTPKYEVSVIHPNPS